MRTKYHFLLLALTNLAFVTSVIAQEICNNGIDDDGDGFIDCYDRDCANTTECEDFFFGSSVECYDDIDVTNFSIRQKWTSLEETSSSYATPVVGDLDYDGIPEVVTINDRGDFVYVINGETGIVTASASTPALNGTNTIDPENTPAIANVDRAGNAEILITENNGNDLVLYDNELNVLWEHRASSTHMGIAGFADFNEDGIPEIYYKNEIINAVTGDEIIEGSGNWREDYVYGPIAVDILDASDADCIAAGGNCDGLELVTGNEIWAVDIANGTMVVVKDMNDALDASGIAGDYFPRMDGGSSTRSTTSVADFNLNGSIDVLLSGSLGSDHNDPTTIFMWDVVANSVLIWQGPDFPRGPGRINIGDVDGDGQLNANFLMDQTLYSLDENLQFNWSSGFKEGSSGFTGCTLFDFDGDGATEIVYRDEEYLNIVDGIGNGDGTTSIRNRIPCISRTQEEYPIVADVDGDGASEICVTCYFDDNRDFGSVQDTQFGAIRVYESDGESWMPARSVWNQHGYYNVNINDDLTVPIEVQDHSVVFSDGVCTYSDGSEIPFPVRPLNSFLNQAPVLDENGCVEFVTPDIVLLGDDITATNAQCPQTEITITFGIANEGDTDISGTLPVSYYAGDPTVSGSIYITTKYITLSQLDVDESITVTHTINGIGGDYELFIVANDFGGTPPIASSFDDLPSTAIPECETLNNYGSVPVTNDPFPLTVEKLEDDRRCDLNLEANGSATTYFEGDIPGSVETIWLENFEDLAEGTTNDTGETAWTSDEGDVAAESFGVTDEGTGSNAFGGEDLGGDNGSGSISWTSEPIDISDYSDVSITIDFFEYGELESNSDINPERRDFFSVQYEIRDNNNSFLSSGFFDTNGSVNGNFTNIQASHSGIRTEEDDTDSLLIITVVMHTNVNNEEMYMDNINVSGTAADISGIFTEADGFQFYWFNEGDYDDTLHVGGTNYQMAAGTYDVIGAFPSTNCISDIVSVTIDPVTPEVHVWAYPVSPLTSCSSPDGILSAFVYTTTTNGTFPADEGAGNLPLDTLRTVDGYTFTWFIESEGTTPIATGDTAVNLSAITYTVEADELFSGCQGSGGATVLSDLTILPPPTVTVTPITSCGGTGFLSADVNGNTADFTFEWYGPSGDATPDFTGPVYEVLEIGEYTVIATENNNGCVTEEGSGTMVDNTVLPTPSTNLIQDNTSCVAGNGIVSADGDGAGTTTGYTFEWFLGNNTLASNTLPGSAAPGAFLVSDNPFELGGLEEGIYTVRVTLDSTSCSTTTTVEVEDVDGSIAVDVSAMDTFIEIDGCDPSSLGSIDASGIVDDPTNIPVVNINQSFEEPLTSNDALRQAGSADNWSYFNQEDVPGWSTTATDNFIEFWNRNNNLGSGLPFDGDQFAELNAEQVSTLYFDLSTTPGGFFNWSFHHRGRLGVDEVALNIGDPTNTLLQNTFITDNDEWALYEGTYIIPDDQFITRFEFESVATTGGDPKEGNFLDLVTFQLFQYRFELYEGTVASGTADSVNTTGLFDNLEEGDYVLVVYDNETGCSAEEIPILIERIPDTPTIVTDVIEDTFCTEGIGSGSIEVTSSAATAGTYTYELYEGNSFTTLLTSVTNIDGAVGHMFENLPDGDYRIQVINEVTLCSEFVDEFVDEIITTPTFSTTVNSQDNTSCDTENPNGSITVTVNEGPAANYHFTWYNDPDTTGLAPIADGDGLNELIELNGDTTYVVVARDLVTGCPTLLLTEPIANDPYVPSIEITQSAQTDCIGNGSLEATITNDPDGAFDPNNYSFQWQLDGVDLVDGVQAANGSIPSGAQTNTLSGLVGEGNEIYTVVVTHTALGCTGTQDRGLDYDPDLPVVSEDSKDNNDSCDPAAYNGFITVAVEFQGSNVTDFTGYTFTWFEVVGSTKVLNTSSTTETLSGIDEGAYAVVVEAPNSCPSDTLQINIIDEEPNLEAGLTGSIIPNSICDPDLNDPSNPDANGEVTFTPSGGTSTYAFELISLLIGSTVDNAGNTSGYENVTYDNTGVTTTTISGLPDGNYQLIITDETSTCFIDTLFTVDPVPDIVTVDEVAINASATPNSSCDPANYNGSATVDIADISGAGTTLGDYSFFWATAEDPNTQIDDDFHLDMDGVVGHDGDLANNGVEDGDYVLIVTDLITGCVSDIANITVGEDFATIVIAASVTKNDFGCTGIDTGEITASITSGTTDYTMAWYSGSTADGTPLNTTVNTDNTISGLSARFYTVEVTDNITLCTETALVEVQPETLTLTPVMSQTPQTNCNVENGTVSVDNVTVLGVPTGPTGHNPTYKYDWYLGTTQLVEIPFTGLSGVFEEGETISIGTVTATIIVFDDADDLILAADPSGDITNGLAISGAISGATATVNTTEDITTTGTVDASTLTNLVANTYTVIVTDLESGCVSDPTPFEVIDNTGTLPTISFTNIDIPSSCDGAGGSIVGVITGGTGPFISRWYEGSEDFTNDDDFSGALIDGQTLVSDEDDIYSITVDNTTPTPRLGNIINGLYTLVVETGNGCRVQATYDLPFNGIQTTTTLTVAGVTECPDNGIAQVSLADNLTITVDPGRTTELSALETFTTAGGTEGVISFDDGNTTIQLSISNAVPLVDGDIITGDISGNSATISTGGIAGIGYNSGEADDISEYIIYLYAGNGVPADRTAPYTITNSVGDPLVFPYTYHPLTGDIFDGDGVLLGNNFGTDDDDSDGKVGTGEDVTFSNLPYGPYTAIAQENPTVGTPATTNFGSSDQCWTSSISEEIQQEAFDPIIVDTDIVPDTFCDSDNGQISITITENEADTVQGSGLIFEWYTSADVNFLTDTIDNSSVPLLDKDTVIYSTLDTLAAGDYYVEITRFNSTTGIAVGCAVVSADLTIIEEPEIHEIVAITTPAENTNCDPFNGEAEIIEINANGVSVFAPFSDYLFKWHLADQTTQIIYVPYTNLAGGNFESGDALTFSGGGTATVISDDNVGSIVAEYTSTVLIGNAETFNNGSGVSAETVLANDIDTDGSIGDHHYTGLENGEYYVTIRHNSSGCPTSLDFFRIEIQNEIQTPTFIVSSTEADISCDGVNPTGEAAATLTNSSTAPGDYNYYWYFDNLGSNLLDASDAPELANIAFLSSVNANTNNGEAGVDSVKNLPAGTYYVQIEDLTTPGDGCLSEILPVIIDPFTTTITIVAADTTHVNDCNPHNGSFEVVTVSESRPGGTSTTVSIADYDFEWFESDGINTIGSNTPLISGLSPDNYFVRLTNTITGCQGDLMPFEIRDEIGSFLIAKDEPGSNDDTFCDQTDFNGDGTLVVTLTESEKDGTIVPLVLSDYLIEWYRDGVFLIDNIGSATGSNLGSTTIGADILTLNGLEASTYTINITKQSTSPNVGCTLSASFDVNPDNTHPLIDRSAIQANASPDTLCIGNSGTIIILPGNIEYGGASLTDFTDFEITVTDSVGTDVVGSPFVAPALDANGGITIESLAEGEYLITATHMVTGCSSATEIINITDESRDPEIDLVSVTPNEDCGGGVMIGGAEVIVDDLFDHTASFLTFQWFDVSAGTNVSTSHPGVVDNQAILTGVSAGEYTVTVTNTNTNCTATLPVTIPNEELDITIIDYDFTDVTICSDNGTFSVIEVIENGNTLTPADMTGDYVLEVYDDVSLAPVNQIIDADITDFIMENLAVDSYFALVRNIASNCTSNVISFDIADEITYPSIQISLVAADSTCDGTVTPTGELSATADGVDDTDPTYTFTWFEGSGTGSPLGLTTSTISDLSSGIYTLVVLNTATGCATEEEFEVPHVPTNVSIINIDPTPDNSCVTGTGTLTVDNVSVDNISDYTFDYYDEDPTSVGAVPIEDDHGPTLIDLEAGMYFVIGYNTRLGCTTPPYQVEIIEDVIYPVITLESFDLQTNCDSIGNPNGRLTIFVDGAVPTTDYTIEWYAEDDLVTGLGTNDTLSNLAEGVYIAQVENNISGCISEQAFEIINDVTPIELNISMSPNTSCDNPNGILAVSIIQTAPGRTITDYDYLWYNGQIDDPDPTLFDFSGTLIDNLPGNQHYTVLVVDQTDNACMSQVTTVFLPDQSVYPPYEFFKSDLTLCFEDQKNGSAQVTVDRELPINQNIMVEWFDGDNALISTNEFIDSLDVGQYSVTLTNLTNGCDTTQIFFIDNLPPEVPVPTLTLTGNRTNCSEPNGQALANVAGETNGYLFEWVDLRDPETVYATGSKVFNLDSGTYEVTATNLSTGCTASNTISIEYEITDPIFEIQYELATCLRTEDGAINQFDGTAIVAFDQFNNVTEFRWENEAGETVGIGTRLIDAGPGIYTVYFTADNGCEYSETFELGTDITIYNGLSPNDDGLNDFLLLDCIDYFENNNVKIFNRAGVKVYEKDYYNNTSNRFEGFSNVGGSALTLPTGTYFTIVELNDGREPIQFYIELVR